MRPVAKKKVFDLTMLHLWNYEINIGETPREARQGNACDTLNEEEDLTTTWIDLGAARRRSQAGDEI